jgi:hypothetical protein
MGFYTNGHEAYGDIDLLRTGAGFWVLWSCGEVRPRIRGQARWDVRSYSHACAAPPPSLTLTGERSTFSLGHRTV